MTKTAVRTGRSRVTTMHSATDTDIGVFNIKCCLMIFMTLSSGMDSEAGTTSVALSPSGLIPVCSGSQLELRCTTTGRFLEWYILRSPENGHNPVNFGGRIFNNQPDQMSSYTLINHVFFNFSVVSVPNTLTTDI